MSVYANQSDLVDYFGSEELLRMADRDGSGDYDTDVISSALRGASEKIDSYLAVRYDLPLTVISGTLVDICCDLVMYRLSINGDGFTTDKEIRYNNAIEWLDKITKGLVSLGVDEEDVDVQDATTISTSSPTRIFTRAKMAGIL